MRFISIITVHRNLLEAMHIKFLHAASC